MIDPFEKRAAEAVVFEIDMSGRLPEGILLHAAGSTCQILDKFDRDRTADFMAASSPVVTVPAENKVKVSMKAGTAQPVGEYLGLLTLVLASGATPLVEPFKLMLRAPRP